MYFGAECLELVCILSRASEAENLVTVGEELLDDGSSDKASSASDENEHPVFFFGEGEEFGREGCTYEGRGARSALERTT